LPGFLLPQIVIAFYAHDVGGHYLSQGSNILSNSFGSVVQWGPRLAVRPMNRQNDLMNRFGPSAHEEKVADFIQMCADLKAKGVTQVVIAQPSALGHNYEEMVESLTRLADAGAPSILLNENIAPAATGRCQMKHSKTGLLTVLFLAMTLCAQTNRDSLCQNVMQEGQTGSFISI
jgi:hypothetical protein